MEDNKYVVFKREDFGEFTSNLEAVLSDRSGILMMPDPVADAVVIRRSDRHSGAAYHGYLNSLRTEDEVLEGIGVRPEDPRRQGLIRAEEYMLDAALDAEGIRREHRAGSPD